MNSQKTRFGEGTAYWTKNLDWSRNPKADIFGKPIKAICCWSAKLRRGKREELAKTYPQHRPLIGRLTRDEPPTNERTGKDA